MKGNSHDGLCDVNTVIRGDWSGGPEEPGEAGDEEEIPAILSRRAVNIELRDGKWELSRLNFVKLPLRMWNAMLTCTTFW